MSALKVICETGNFAADRIFQGMYGHVDAIGQFNFDASLMGLDVAKNLHKSIKQGRQSFTESQLHTIDTDEAAQQVIKGVLLIACQKRWNESYDMLIAGLSHSPVVASMILGAKEADSMTADMALVDLGLKESAEDEVAFIRVDVGYNFVNAAAREDESAFAIDTLRALQRIDTIAEVGDDATHLSGPVYVAAQDNFFHGQGRARLRLPANLGEDTQLQTRVVEALLKMPQALLSQLNLVEQCSLNDEPQFTHQEMVQRATSVVPIEAQPAVPEDASRAAAAFLDGASATSGYADDSQDLAQEAPGAA